MIRAGEQTEQEKLELAIIENLQREDLKPRELAMFIKKKMDEGEKQAHIAELLGVNRSMVTNHLALIEQGYDPSRIYGRSSMNNAIGAVQSGMNGLAVLNADGTVTGTPTSRFGNTWRAISLALDDQGDTVPGRGTTSAFVRKGDKPAASIPAFMRSGIACLHCSHS